MAKRMLTEVWKAKGRKAHKAVDDHSTRESLTIESMQGVVIVIQPMHNEL